MLSITHGYWLVVVVASLWVVSCQPGQLQQLISPEQTPMLVPTFTPTAAAAIAQRSQDSATIDAEGLDIAERRVIDVYERVAPSVVSITTQVLRRGFFF